MKTFKVLAVCLFLMVEAYPDPGKRLADKLAEMSAKGNIFVTFAGKYFIKTIGLGTCTD